MARQICALFCFESHGESDHVFATLLVEILGCGGGGGFPNHVAGVVY